MKKNDVPISLFSFQDIITSLTGIMIIVILVISLQMMDSTVKFSTPADPEWQEMLQTYEKLHNKLEQIKNAPIDEELLEKIQQFLDYTEEDLAQLLENIQKKNEHMRAEIDDMRNQCETKNEELEELKEKYKNKQATCENLLAENAKEIDELQEKLNNCKTDESSLKEKIRILKQANHVKEGEAKMQEQKLAFSFEGTRTKTPILIECLANGFRASVYLSNEIKDYTDGNFSGNLKKLISELRKFDDKQYYAVFLYRKEALVNMYEIENELSRTLPKMSIGKDPLNQKVKVF